MADSLTALCGLHEGAFWWMADRALLLISRCSLSLPGLKCSKDCRLQLTARERLYSQTSMLLLAGWNRVCNSVSRVQLD